MLTRVVEPAFQMREHSVAPRNLLRVAGLLKQPQRKVNFDISEYCATWRHWLMNTNGFAELWTALHLGPSKLNSRMPRGGLVTNLWYSKHTSEVQPSRKRFIITSPVSPEQVAIFRHSQGK